MVSTKVSSMYDAYYENAGQYLDPYKYKQNEIGFKLKSGNLLHTLSAFKIENQIMVMYGKMENSTMLNLVSRRTRESNTPSLVLQEANLTLWVGLPT